MKITSKETGLSFSELRKSYKNEWETIQEWERELCKDNPNGIKPTYKELWKEYKDDVRDYYIRKVCFNPECLSEVGKQMMRE